MHEDDVCLVECSDGVITFNSLFEMQVGVRIPIDAEQVRQPFNSLFEMHFQAFPLTYNKRAVAYFQFSI